MINCVIDVADEMFHKCFIVFVFLPTVFCPIKSDEDYPELEDLFPTIGGEEQGPIKEVNLDLDRLDIDKFIKKLEKFESEIAPNVTLVSPKPVKPVPKDTRRQIIPYHTIYQWNRASYHILKVKTIDMMLQTIYMARHRIRQLENEDYYDSKDTAYRVAFLYRKIRKLWRRIMDIYTQIEKMHAEKKEVTSALTIHLKVIKLYEKFMYLWWVLIAVDGKYQDGLKGRKLPGIKKPTPTGNSTAQAPAPQESPAQENAATDAAATEGAVEEKPQESAAPEAPAETEASMI